MKSLMIAIALVGAASATSAFAQTSAPVTQQPAAAATQVASDNTQAAAQAGQWVPPYGQPIVGKTRAQVYQELVQAEKDGQLAYLNSTLYSH
ncbi:hypothetical protein BWP39_13430 [Paraburkholderia acidicola]|uniref:DUF4148 domain-containing protein n=1 Tax=Paraburkholderia acidicola TaxID=1912599 RepID=A0A2A4EYZ5_9BURK|nr:DUF4148 domain-containing protein [Paraburkholderia acidicola]PCE25524.1 hypothetical protein BWP39_13430 [Paraburkholderia acidicola]